MTREDWRMVFIRFARKQPFTLVPAGVFDVTVPVRSFRFDDLPEFGNSATGKLATDPAVLVAPEGLVVATSAVAPGSYEIAQRNNPGALRLKLGGQFRDALIAGQVDVESADERSLVVLAQFTDVLDWFIQLGPYAIGPYALVHDELRRTEDIDLPKETDLIDDRVEARANSEN